MPENAVAAAIAEEQELEIPDQLPVLPLHHGVLFPELTVPLLVSRPEHIKLVDDALVKDRVLVAVAQRDNKIEKPTLVDLHRLGVAVFILKMMRSPEGHYHLLVRTSKKLQLLETVQEEPYLVVRVAPIEETVQSNKQIEAMVVNIRNLFQRIVELTGMPQELALVATNVEGPYPLAYLVASNLDLKVDEAQEVTAEAFKRGLYLVNMGAFGTRALRVAPPLIMNKEQADASLEILETEPVIETLFQRGQKLMDGIQEILNRAGMPHFVTGLPPMFSFVLGVEEEPVEFRDYCAGDDPLYERLAMALIEREVMLDCDGREPWFLCYSHSEQDIAETLTAFEDAVKTVKREV